MGFMFYTTTSTVQTRVLNKGTHPHTKTEKYSERGFRMASKKFKILLALENIKITKYKSELQN